MFRDLRAVWKALSEQNIIGHGPKSKAAILWEIYEPIEKKKCAAKRAQIAQIDLYYEF